jgi:hypothetical protein
MKNQKDFIKNMHHEDWRVRLKVAKRIDIEYLPKMINDISYYVRTVVAQRIDPSFLPQMMNDEDMLVRCEVAMRINKKNALLMSALDESKTVRYEAWKNVMGSL